MTINENVRNSWIVKHFSELISNSIFQVVSFAILTFIAAQISVPVKPVPFTLQTMMVVLAGAALGPKKGAYSQMLYITAGALGMPVFADFSLGLAVLAGPTGGYLLAFPLAAYLTGVMVKKYNNYFMVSVAMFLANILVIVIGTLFLHFTYLHDFNKALASGAVIFSVWTVVKVFLAAGVYSSTKKLF